MNGLLTDLYELTMAAGYHAAGKLHARAAFDVSIRRLPRNRDFVIVAGIEKAVEYLENLSLSETEIDYLKTIPQFARVDSSFWDYLRAFRFTGDVDAVAEGTPLFAGEPLMTLRAPLIEAQIPETYLLSALTFETLIASKASRMVSAAQGRPVMEFGTRRAHTPEAGTLAARAAYIGGCAGTSNVLAGQLYGVPIFGTAAHSWVMSFTTEIEAFRALQSLLGENTVQLIDTYDALEGARTAASLGAPLRAVRIDSGDLDALSRKVRVILDDAGLKHTRIMATGDLEEHRIAELVAGGAPIDAFGVGTELVTSGDAPSMGMIYKLVELSENGATRLTAKRSPDKPSIPGAKQIWRFPDHDLVALASEHFDGAAKLLQPLIRNGRRVAPAPALSAARALACCPRVRPVRHSQLLEEEIARFS